MFLSLCQAETDSLAAVIGLKDPRNPSAPIQWPLVPSALTPSLADNCGGWVEKEYEFKVCRPLAGGTIAERSGPEICHGRIIFTQDCEKGGKGGPGRSRGYITNFQLIGSAPAIIGSSSSSSSSSSSQRGK